MARRRRLLTVTQAANYLGVARRTIYNWERSGLIGRVAAEGKFAQANLDRIKKKAEEEGVHLTYTMIRRHHDRQGIPDGRRRESIDA